METTNKISATRHLIAQTIRELTARLDFETDTLETEMGPDAMVYVELLCNDCGGYYEVNIQDVSVNKDTYRRECLLPNISEHIYCKLDKRVAIMNREVYNDWWENCA